MKISERIVRSLYGLPAKEERGVNAAYYPPGFLTNPVKGSIGVVTEDLALRISAVFACVNIIASSLSNIPWVLLEDTGTKIQRAISHPVYPILKRQANQVTTSKNYRKALLANALLWGNGYAAIVRNPSTGQPVYLNNLLSRNVTVYKHEGDLWYRDASTGITYHSSDIIHVKGVGLDGIMGLSPIRQMRNTMVTASGVDSFGADFYEAGTIMAGYVKHPSPMTKDQYQNYVLYWEQNWAGGQNRGKTPLLDGGAEYVEVGMPLADAQFLESKKFNVDDIARVFQVPPHKIGNMDRSTFNNIEEQNIDFVETTLLNWATELEAEHNLKLIIPQAGKDIYNKLELKGLLRGDIESRTAFYTAMFDRGVFNGNDIAKLEEMNEYDGGDIRFVSQNLRGLKEPANERPTNSNPS